MLGVLTWVLRRYNPEFIAQGDVVNGLLHPDMVLIGEGSPEIGARLETIYKASTQNTPEIHRMAPESAEITKLAGTTCHAHQHTASPCDTQQRFEWRSSQ